MKTPDEIKKALKLCTYEPSCRGCPYGGDDCDDLDADALEYIQQLEAAQMKWISVDERLPDEGQMVLAYTHYFYEVLQWYEKSKQWISAYGWYSQEHVTHWMPLPEPPNEIRKGDT